MSVLRIVLLVERDDLPASWDDDAIRREVRKAVSRSGFEFTTDDAPAIPPAVLVLLRALVVEVERAAKPISSKDAVDYTDNYAEHHRAIGAIATLAGQVGRQLGAPDLEKQAMAAIGIKVP